HCSKSRRETAIIIASPSLWCLTGRCENSLPLAAWIVQARGVVGNCACRAAASLFDGLDRIRGTVREFVAVENQRLLEANEIGVVPAGKHLGLDLVEPPIGVEYRDRRT